MRWVITIIALTLFCWAAEPLESLFVVIPDYSIREIGGLHYVDIPGGKLLMFDGQPRLPFYPVTVSYPAGYYVQDVKLTNKTGRKVETGIRLPAIAITVDTLETFQPPKPAVTRGWYPDKDFDWRIWHNPQGGTDLVLSLYPLKFNSAVAELEFHKEHYFQVKWKKTGITSVHFSSDKITYQPGERVLLNLRLENTTEPKDLLAKATVSGPVSINLPERKFRILTGDTTITLEWLTGSAPTGDYRIDLLIIDEKGATMAREQRRLRLGIPAGEVVSFTAEPSVFHIGDNIKFTLEFRNTGSCSLSGEGVFRIFKEGRIIAESLCPYNNLLPGASITLRSGWNTAKAEKGAVYYISGFVCYEGSATPTQHIYLSTNRPPIASFSFVPEQPSAGEIITFDASASADADGTIARYEWSFGDGARAEGKNVTHQYQLPGTYEVKLTVTDNEGGKGMVARMIEVRE